MFFKKKQETRTYDRQTQKPVIRSSICTGEKSAGFRDLRTGKFTEILLLRTPGDLEEFRRLYGIGEEEISTEYLKTLGCLQKSNTRRNPYDS